MKEYTLMRSHSAAQYVKRSSVTQVIGKLMNKSILIKRPYNCSKCDKKFTTSSALKTHEQIQTNEKPFSCSQFDYKCKTSSSLKTHERIHTDKKPFSCSKCDKKFSQGHHLKTHERIHVW